MCGYQGQTIAATPAGTTTLRPYQPVFIWNDPRMQGAAKPYASSTAPAESDPAFAQWKATDDYLRGEHTMLVRRRAVLAAIFQTYPMAAHAVGSKSPFGGGPYKKMNWDDSSTATSCTSTNPTVVQTAGKNANLKADYSIAPAPAWTGDDGKYHPAISGHPAWVPYAPGKLPSVGDSYILTGSKENAGKKSYGRFLHVGTVVHVDVSAEDVYWITADGGQKANGGEAAHLVRRKFNCMTEMPKKPNAPHFSGGAEGDLKRLHGWLDIGDSRVAFDDAALATANLDADYLSCGAWIERARKG